jgi:hypothetical protein
MSAQDLGRRHRRNSFCLKRATAVAAKGLDLLNDSRSKFGRPQTGAPRANGSRHPRN